MGKKLSAYQKERREHPKFTSKQIRQIVADHKKKKGK
jgi:hypothetical protein